MKQRKKCIALINIAIIIITAIMILSSGKVSSIITNLEEGLRLGRRRKSKF